MAFTESAGRPRRGGSTIMWVGKIIARPPPYRVLPGKVRAREGYLFAGYLSYATITITIPFTSADASLVIVDE